MLPASLYFLIWSHYHKFKRLISWIGKKLRNKEFNSIWHFNHKPQYWKVGRIYREVKQGHREHTTGCKAEHPAQPQKDPGIGHMNNRRWRDCLEFSVRIHWTYPPLPLPGYLPIPCAFGQLPPLSKKLYNLRRNWLAIPNLELLDLGEAEGKARGCR